MVKTQPDGYRTVIPSLVVNGAAGLIAFLESVFGAKQRMLLPMPDGRVGHAELELGDSMVMVSDPTMDATAMQNSLYLFVDNVDDRYRRAVTAGARSLMEPADQFYGDRVAAIIDGWGNRYTLATHIEDVPEDETLRRMQALMTGAV